MFLVRKMMTGFLRSKHEAGSGQLNQFIPYSLLLLRESRGYPEWKREPGPQTFSHFPDLISI